MATKIVKSKKKAIKEILNPLVSLTINSQMATAAPPLGPALGKRGVNVAEFCKNFNKTTQHIKPGIPLPTQITVMPDRSYKMSISSPDTTWLLMMASGIRWGKTEKDEITAKLSVKHIYEIAKVKSQDNWLIGVPLKDVCKKVIETAHEIGIQIQYGDLDTEEYKKFLDERREIVAGKLQEIEEINKSKILRS